LQTRFTAFRLSSSPPYVPLGWDMPYEMVVTLASLPEEKPAAPSKRKKGIKFCLGFFAADIRKDDGS
jgi:hypothetical protein